MPAGSPHAEWHAEYSCTQVKVGIQIELIAINVVWKESEMVGSLNNDLHIVQHALEYDNAACTGVWHCMACCKIRLCSLARLAPWEISFKSYSLCALILYLQLEFVRSYSHMHVRCCESVFNSSLSPFSTLPQIWNAMPYLVTIHETKCTKQEYSRYKLKSSPWNHCPQTLQLYPNFEIPLNRHLWTILLAIESVTCYMSVPSFASLPQERGLVNCELDLRCCTLMKFVDNWPKGSAVLLNWYQLEADITYKHFYECKHNQRVGRLSM